MLSAKNIIKGSLYTSLVIFSLSTYFGIVGFESPWTIISIISSLSFFAIIILAIVDPFYNLIVDIIDYNKKEDNKKTIWEIIYNFIKPILLYSLLFIWAKFFNSQIPFYGEHKIYNPLSFLFGKKFYGDQLGHNFFTKIYSWFLTLISATLYISGITFSNNFFVLTYKTLMKMLLGYVTPNDKIAQNWWTKFMQYRIYEHSFFSKYVGAPLRKYSLLGIDLPALDRAYLSNSFSQEGKLQFLSGFFNKLIENEKNTTYVLNWLYFALFGFIIYPIIYLINYLGKI